MRRHKNGSPLPCNRRATSPLRLVTYGAMVVTMAGCGDFLSVTNPNNMTQDDLLNPSAAGAVANGAVATVTRGAGYAAARYAAATDEVTWIGSRDDWDNLSMGWLASTRNEFSDAMYPYVSESRWMADEAIRILEAHQEAGTLSSPAYLARAYLYGAVIYTIIGNTFEDFVLSDRTVAEPPVGAENMGEMFATAIEYASSGLAIATSAGDADLVTTLTAMRARAIFDLGVWEKLNPKPASYTGRASEGLVTAPDAVLDAQEVLSRLGAGSDWRFELDYDVATVSNDLASNVNQRPELQLGPTYITPHPTDFTQILGISLIDPIDGIPDPFVTSVVTTFMAGSQYSSLTFLSAREMNLIIAEDALASGDPVTAAAYLNNIRALDGLSPFSGQIPLLEMLQYERQRNLFLQFHRLGDHYRFGSPAPEWLPNSDAVSRPGTLFPITEIERRANPYLE